MLPAVGQHPHAQVAERPGAGQGKGQAEGNGSHSRGRGHPGQQPQQGNTPQDPQHLPPRRLGIAGTSGQVGQQPAREHVTVDVALIAEAGSVGDDQHRSPAQPLFGSQHQVAQPFTRLVAVHAGQHRVLARIAPTATPDQDGPGRPWGVDRGARDHPETVPPVADPRYGRMGHGRDRVVPLPRHGDGSIEADLHPGLLQQLVERAGQLVLLDHGLSQHQQRTAPFHKVPNSVQPVVGPRVDGMDQKQHVGIVEVLLRELRGPLEAAAQAGDELGQHPVHPGRGLAVAVVDRLLPVEVARSVGDDLLAGEIRPAGCQRSQQRDHDRHDYGPPRDRVLPPMSRTSGFVLAFALAPVAPLPLALPPFAVLGLCLFGFGPVFIRRACLVCRHGAVIGRQPRARAKHGRGHGHLDQAGQQRHVPR